jgi:alpha-glucosidase
MYQLYRSLIELRRKRAALSLGGYGSILADDDLLVFTRDLARERILIALNFGGEATAASGASGEMAGRLLLSSAGDRENEPVRGSVELRPHEGVVVEIWSAG